MRKLTILAAVGGALVLASPAVAVPRHPRKLVVGVALTRAYHYWGAWPSCGVRFQFGALPPQVGMEPIPACLVRANQAVWTRATIGMAADPGSDGYRQLVWQVFCASAISDIGVMLGRTNISTMPGRDWAAEYTYCGTGPTSSPSGR